MAQTANFHGETSMTEEEIKDYLNRYLPEDIGIWSVEKISPRFHSRRSACEKTYLYQIETGKKANVFERKYVYCLGKNLDLERMRRGAALLLGERDFKSFCSNKRMKKSTIRNLISISIEEKGSKVLIRYRGNGFLYNMVRILTGTLIEIGLGDRKAEDVIRILEKKDRAAAGPTAVSYTHLFEGTWGRGKDGEGGTCFVFLEGRRKEREYARVAQLVEYNLAKVGVAGSSPVSRSKEPEHFVSVQVLCLKRGCKRNNFFVFYIK